MRSIITRVIAILLVVGAIYGAKAIIGNKKKNIPKSISNIPTAYVTPALNKIVPVSITESGRLTAKHKIDLYAEVQGVMQPTSKEFKPGTTFQKGEILVQIKNDDYRANLQAQKSVLQNLITSILPDLKLDYPEAYKKWDTYLKEFSIEDPITPLPEPGSDKEKFFLTGKNIYTTFYNTKNLEIIYKKYTLTAPYSGILTEALVNPGTLIRNGQKLGQFIKPAEYELELAISKNLITSVQVGKDVTITNPENTLQIWNGKVSRINGKVNPTTQTIQIFITLNGDGLKEGMYLEATIAGQEKLNAVELPRNLLIDEHQLYVVQNDTQLILKNINVVHKSRKNVIVQGIDNGDLIITKPIPGAYSGMTVIIKTQE
jgi:multidrug efflux pump subunit AcrA (membrane-fusion protein)